MHYLKNVSTITLVNSLCETSNLTPFLDVSKDKTEHCTQTVEEDQLLSGCCKFPFSICYDTNHLTLRLLSFFFLNNFS